MTSENPARAVLMIDVRYRLNAKSANPKRTVTESAAPTAAPKVFQPYRRETQPSGRASSDVRILVASGRDMPMSNVGGNRIRNPNDPRVSRERPIGARVR